MSLDISEMRPEDRAEVQALVGADLSVRQPNQESSSTVERVLRYESVLSLVAREEGTVVGAIMCRRDRSQGYMHQVVLADTQRRSLAKMLVDRALRKLMAQGGYKCRIRLPQGEHQLLFWEAVKWDDRMELAQQPVPSSAAIDRMANGWADPHETDPRQAAGADPLEIDPTA